LVFVRELLDRFERTGHSKDLDVEGMVEIILIYKKWNAVMWPGFIWLRIGAYKLLPWRGKRLGFSYMKGNIWSCRATHKGLYSIELTDC
jgi:hypothetical protein